MMFEAMGRIRAYTEGFDEDRFCAESRTVDAVALNLLVIGECSIRLSEDLKTTVPAPWPRIAGLRHHIAHGYQSLSPSRLWQTATQSAPELERLILTWRDRN